MKPNSRKILLERCDMLTKLPQVQVQHPFWSELGDREIYHAEHAVSGPQESRSGFFRALVVAVPLSLALWTVIILLIRSIW